MRQSYHHAGVSIYHGKCEDVLRELPDASVDSIVTDPPSGIGFMGIEWDKHKGGRAGCETAGAGPFTAGIAVPREPMHAWLGWGAELSGISGRLSSKRNLED